MTFTPTMQAIIRGTLILCALAIVVHSEAQAPPPEQSKQIIRLITIRYINAALLADLFGGQVIQADSYSSGGNQSNTQGNGSQGGRNRGGGNQGNTSRNGAGGRR